MSTEADRRAHGAQRIPFEALVEVGGAQLPSFEAQAVNVSEDGMLLRTAYLPEAGQPLTCRFEAADGQVIVAHGEVAWTTPSGCGGDFGVKFTGLDPESAASLRKMTGSFGAPGNGAKVRLHIEGLASPMRARVKGTHDAELTVGSELAFLQVGKQLELEDAQSGQRRPARIEKVQVEMDEASNIPQLVVALRYERPDAAAQSSYVEHPAPAPEPEIHVEAEEPSPAPAEDSAPEPTREPEAAPVAARESAPPATEERGDLESVGRASEHVKGALVRGAGQVGSALAAFGQRAKTAMALFAAKRAAAAKEQPVRRKTAPAPGGGLHATGRRVVRGDAFSSRPEASALPRQFVLTKRKLAVGGALGVALILAAFALRKPDPEPPLASAPPEVATAAAPQPFAQSGTAAAAGTGVSAYSAALVGSPTQAPLANDPAVPAYPPAAPPGAEVNPFAALEGPSDAAERESRSRRKQVKVAPFGNGPVAHANVLRLRMDGTIEKIEGASQPTGFTVRIPWRRSLEAAGPLAARDARIASIRVSNEPGGAELSVAFKDGVPNYQVRAKGDTLEIALAPVGTGREKTVAKKDTHEKKHGKKKREGASHKR